VRKRRKRKPDRRWLVLPILAGLLLLVVVAAGLLARDVLEVRTALRGTQQSLLAVQEALGSADISAASEELQEADEQLGVARSRTRGPLWSMAAAVPFVNQPVRTVRGIVDVASAATAVAEVVIREGSELSRSGLSIRVSDGQLDQSPLDEAARVLAAAPVEPLREATEGLRATDPGWSPAEVVDARTQSLELADRALATLDVGRPLLAALPGFLGADEQRRYFLGVQTSAELRGTGGLIGFYSVLTVDDGRFSIGTVDVYEGLDDAAIGDDDVRVLTGPIGGLAGEGAVPASPEFEARYGHTEATSRFSNVNVHPDLPTTASIALDLYEERTGERLDGLILLDAIGMQRILEATDTTLELPEDLREDTDLPETIGSQDFARFITSDIYEELGDGRSRQRKDLLAAIGAAAFDDVFDGAWDGIRLSRAVGEATGGRNLQVFSRNEEEQASFTAIRATGELSPPVPGDLLAVTMNNAVGGKQDVHLGHRFEVDVQLSEPRLVDDEVRTWRTSSVRTQIVNPLPSEGRDLYVIGNCVVDGERNECFEGPPGWNRTWVSMWTPGDDTLLGSRGPDGPTEIIAGFMDGLRVFDRFLEVPPQDESWVQIDVEGPVELDWDGGDDVTYTWTWWRQAKATPDLLDATFDLPAGWQVVTADLDGVGDGRNLLGLDAGSQPAEAEVTGTVGEDGTGAQQVHVRGAVVRDTTLVVRVTRDQG
jgi:hypothetical protein